MGSCFMRLFVLTSNWKRRHFQWNQSSQFYEADLMEMDCFLYNPPVKFVSVIRRSCNVEDVNPVTHVLQDTS
jgi:hypothetical protein